MGRGGSQAQEENNIENKAVNELTHGSLGLDCHGSESYMIFFPTAPSQNQEISDCVVKTRKNSKKQNEARCEGSKKERSQNGNSKKGNFQKAF